MLFDDTPLNNISQRSNDSAARIAEEEGTFYERIMARRSTSLREQTPLLAADDDDTTSLRQRLSIARVDSDEDSEDRDPLLEVIDRIEDEVDHAWEDVVPLEVKLALEEKVFGWSHLTSDILGHILFTVAAYSIVFFFITHVAHKPERMPMILFRMLRFTFSFWAGLSAYRMVRRRRRVWLRSAYGSKDYEKDSRRRRDSVREIDRTTLLGRIRRSRALRAAKKHQKKLRKAVERFEKRDEKRKKTLHGVDAADDEPSLIKSVSLVPKNASDPMLLTANQLKDVRRRTRHSGTFHALPVKETKAIGHDQILFAHGPIQVMPYAHGGFFGAAPFMLANPHWIDVLRLLMPDVYIEISLRVVHAPAPKLIHWAENNPVVAAYGTAHEMDNTCSIPNLEWDVFLDPHLVRRVEVVMKEQEKFLRDCASDDASQELSGKELRHCMLESVDSLDLTTSQRSILAYYEAELRRRIEHLVDNMLIAHGSLTQLVLEQTGYLKKYNFSRVKRARRTLGGGMFARQWLSVYAEALKLGKCLDGSSKEITESKKGQALLYSNSSVLRTNSSSDEDERDDISFRCQCLQCATDSRFLRQQSDLTCTHRRNTASKGLRASQSFTDLLSSEEKIAQEPDIQSAPVFPARSNQVSPLRGGAFAPHEVSPAPKALSTSIAESIAVIKFITGCDDPLGIVFDIKSRHTPKPVWGLIVDYLRDAGARVEGIASFVVDEVRDISQYTSRPVKELFFFHSAGDIQQACHDGRLKPGDAVLFNAGSLLWDSNANNGNAYNCLTFNRYWTPFDANEVKRQYFVLPFAQFHQGSQTSTIKCYKEKFGLSIGLYCQEFAIDEAAISVLVKYVNEHLDVFDLGLSWGGVNGITVRGIQPGRFTLTDGFWNQRYAGETWDYLRRADECDVET